VSGGGMYLYDEKRDELQVVSSTHPVVPVGTILKMGEGMAGRVAKSRQPMMVNNYSMWVYGASQYSAIPFTAVVEAPMLYRGKLIGVLAASEIGDEAHQFTKDDLRLLSLLANGVAGVIQNARGLTERKQVEEKLSESEERFRTFIEQSVDGFMLANEQGTIIAWNQALSQIVGLPREQALGMTMWDLQYQMITPEKRAGLSLDRLRNALQTMQSGESSFFRQANDAEIQTVHGERKFIQQTSFPIHTAQGTRIGTVVRDVTERKQMEIALLENEEKYRDLFEHVPVALWDEDFSSLKTHLDKLRDSGVTDLRAHFEQHPQSVAHCAELIEIIDVNQTTLNLFEAETKEQLLGNLKRIFRYQSPTIIKEEIITLYGGETPYQGEMIAMSVNGNSFHCHIEVAIAPGYEETWKKVFVSVTDITERKQMEEREHEQRTLAEALSNSAAALNSTLNFDDVLDCIIDNVGRVVPHDAANIMLLDVENNKLSLACHRGYVERGAKNSDIEQQFSLATSPILREVARTGRPLAIPNTHAHPDWTSIPATEWVSSYLTAPIQIRRTTVGFLNLDSETTNFFNSNHAERLQAFANHAAIAINNAQLYEDMQVLAVTDALTGAYNRTFFEAELARIELSRDFPVSIIVADLDNLKTINDTFGHKASDELIKNASQIFQETFRAADIIARIGGDEFAVLLPNTNAATAEQMLSRVRTKIVKWNATHTHPSVQLSLGTATAEQGKLMDALTIADQRMYADKATRKSSN
jgi:diguanylate cyclase (GGDEF)-like protein/PAS domain S-box-containing protein